MKRQATTTRERLADAAEAAFFEHGYAGTDTNRIARAAGFSPQTFYRHYRDKQEIFLLVYERWSAELVRTVRAADGPEAVVDVVLAHHRRTATFRSSLLALVASEPAVREAYVARRARQLDAFGAAAPREDVMFVLWSVERVADAIAFGEPAALGVDEATLRAKLVRLVGTLDAR